MKVAVIGAGPSGLVTLKYLLEAHKTLNLREPVDAKLFEEQNEVGGTFRYRTYENAELVSSRQLTLFSDFRIDDAEEDFLSTDQYCQYLERYCKQFNLNSRITFGTRVTKVLPRMHQQGHTVHFTDVRSEKHEDSWECDYIAVCTGLHVLPNIPNIPGIINVPTTLHSSEFKHSGQFGAESDVLILGCGETAMDLAYLAVTSENVRTVTLCHRDGWQNAPKRMPEPIRRGDVEAWERTQRQYGPTPPSDCGSSSLFDTAYLHPALEQWTWDYYDAFTKLSATYLSGTSVGLDQWIGGPPSHRHHARKIIPNKSNKAMPYISAPYKPKVKTKRQIRREGIVRLPETQLNGRQIDLAPWPEHIDSTGRVRFKTTDRPESQGMAQTICRPSVVLFATGYRQEFPFLAATYYPTPDQADVRRIWKTDRPDIGFIGFIRPNFGAIPALAEIQVQLWILNLVGRLPKQPVVTDSYRIRADLGRRIQYGVDHESYAYQLALDSGSAPTFLQVASYGTRVLATWALGPNFNTKFRLVGPWRWEGAAEVMEHELWNVIRRRRGWFVWLFLAFLPMTIFGILSIILCSWDFVFGQLGLSGSNLVTGYCWLRGDVSQKGDKNHVVEDPAREKVAGHETFELR